MEQNIAFHDELGSERPKTNIFATPNRRTLRLVSVKPPNYTEV